MVNVGVVRMNYYAIAPAAATAEDLKEVNYAGIANLIRKDWKKVYFGAVPYLDALGDGVLDATGAYYADDKDTIILYFLANANGWRGAVARGVKADLRRRAA